MPKYLVDLDGSTILRMWSNARDDNLNFTSAIHLVHAVSGDSLCGSLKNSGVGFPADPGDSVEDAITCKRCLRIAQSETKGEK